MLKEILKYMDIFGTKINFYSDKKQKYYTILGGILSVSSILVCIIIFILKAKEDFSRNLPHTIFSSNIAQQQKKINLEQKNIWIPWRILDSSKQYIDNNSLVYPIISYYYGERKSLKEKFQLKSKKIQYQLCNETTMKNLPSVYNIEVPLNELYCFNSTDLELGGSLNDLFINHLTIEFYLCKNGENYDKKNSICSNTDIINEIIGEKNKLEIEIYYPIVHFEPTNSKKPITIFYNKYFYYISKFSIKIDNLYLQNTILMDESGLFNKYINKLSYWTVGKFEGDFYININTNDTINDLNSLKVYSLHIYLEPSVKKYIRSYKKIDEIISEGLTIIYIFYMVFKKVAKVLKTTEENRRLLELLFENMIIKQNKIIEHLNKLNFYNKIKIQKENDESVQYNYSNSINKSQSRSLFMNNSLKQNKASRNNVDFIRNQPQPKSSFAPRPTPNNDIFSENNPKGSNVDIPPPFKKRKQSLYLYHKSPNFLNLKRNLKRPSEFSSHFSNKLIPKKLFPYKYYFFWVFFKIFDISKKTFCYPKKFVKANVFLGQLLDISTYLSFQKEFQILKYRFLSKDELKYIERNNRINISSSGFIRNMNECLENQKFNILANDNSINYA